MDRPSWHSYFLQIAKLTSERSNCMRRKVGAVVVKDNRILGLGQNGTPRGTLNCFEGGCARCNANTQAGLSLEICMCLHAEENALLFIGASDLKDASLQITLCPCLSCCKKILQCQIKEIFFVENYSDQDAINIAQLQKQGVFVSGPHT